MKNILAFFVLFCLFSIQSNFSFAQDQNSEITATELINQFDEKVFVNSNTEWIVFSADKKSSETIGKILEDLKISQLETYKGIFIADISAMPSMITKMFAMPKMKKYSYKLALDKEGDFSKKIPQEKHKATLIEIKNLKIVSQSFSSDPEQIKGFIEKHLNKK